MPYSKHRSARVLIEVLFIPFVLSLHKRVQLALKGMINHSCYSANSSSVGRDHFNLLVSVGVRNMNMDESCGRVIESLENVC